MKTKNPTPQNQQKIQNQKRTKMKFSKFSQYPINPDTDWYKPQNQNEPKTEKHPFLVRFWKAQKPMYLQEKLQVYEQ